MLPPPAEGLLTTKHYRNAGVRYPDVCSKLRMSIRGYALRVLNTIADHNPAPSYPSSNQYRPATAAGHDPSLCTVGWERLRSYSVPSH